MTTLSLRDICNKLTSTQTRSRQSALNELQRFLDHEDASCRFKDENAYAGLLQALSRNFSLELANFRKSNSPQAASLIHLSVECFRASVEKARLIVTRATVRMIVSHIINSLPLPGQKEYKEVASALIASLKLIASYPPHIEQIKKDMWVDMAQLCRTHTEVGGWYNLSNPSNQSTIYDGTHFETQKKLSMRKEVADLVFCLQSLCSFPGAPLHAGEETLLTFILNFLASYDTVSDARVSAVIILNRLLQHITVNRTELAGRASVAIVDLISKIWNGRISGFKERLLVTLALVYPHLHHNTTLHGLAAATRTSIETLLGKLKDDLRNQEHKFGLQIDDLILSPLPPSSPQWVHRPFHYLNGPYFSLNPHSKSAELPWLSLQVQSCFIQLLDLIPTNTREWSSADEVEHEHKRRRLLSNSNLQSLLNDIALYKTQQAGSLGSIQRLAFYLNSFRSLNISLDLSDVLGRLESIGEEINVDIMGWSFVCMLGILGRTEKSGLTALTLEQWSRIWIACLKQAALSPTCRPACAVMDAIIRKDILDLGAILPHIKAAIEYIEQRGPGVFADNSCSFWDSLIQKLEEFGVPTSGWRRDALSRWIRFRWDVERMGDGISRAKRFSTLVFPCLRLFSPANWTSTNLIDIKYLESLPRTPVGESLNTISADMALVNFLLESKISRKLSPVKVCRPLVSLNISAQSDLRDILEEKYRHLCDDLRSYQERGDLEPSIMLPDDMGWFLSLSIISMILLQSKDTLNLLSRISALIATSSESDACIDSCLRAMSQFVQIQDTEFQEHESIERSVQERLQNIYGDASFREFVDVLCRFSRKFDSMGQEPTGDKDFKGMRPQITLSSSTLDESWALRDISRYSFTLDGWRMQLLVRLYTEVHIRDEPIRSLTPYYFQTLETHNLLLAGENVARTIVWFNDDTSQSATEEFLDAFKTDIASTYNWGGNEITTNIAMALISSSLRSIDPNSSIAGLVMQLYRWIVKVVVNRELSSATARLKAVILLREVSEFDIEYGKEAKSESRAGVLLIKLLGDLDVRVKFDLANHVKSTFLHFPLVDQIDVYREIVDNLESDETYSEGFALRAYTLMQLAFASDDIRRAAMVNLLELGKFVSSKLTVHSCFVFLAEHLYRGQLADLFFQNSSQFLCSWIDFEEKIIEFPFHAFGFPDFEFWSASVKDELIAQLVNANRWDDAITIFRASNHFEDTLLSCLPRIVSYHYLHTAELSEQNGIDSAGSIPERCKAVLGADLYVSTLTSRFAHSLAIMVERMDDKTLSAEAFDSLGLSIASATLSAIALPDPGPTYPQPSQPSFAIRNVLTAIESLRRALRISSPQVWTASNTVFVLRQLFDKGIVVSDTTVALCFLRRIVFVLCLARDVISDGYPLEMLFFNLRAFLAHSSLVHASTMQIVKAIFGLGMKFLSGHPDRLRHIVASLLPHFHSLHSPSHKDDDLTSEDYGWLKTFIQTVLPGDSSLHAMTSLLGILNKHHKADAKSVGQIVEDLILEDELLWAESDLYSFSLRLLSFESDVFLEPLSTLTHLVPHFLSSDQYLMDPPTSKRWLGVALGRISRDATFLRPENRTKKVGHRSQKAGDLSNSSSFAVLSEVLRFMRSDSSIAGLLEQALRNVSSLSPFRIPSKFGVDQFIVRSLSSPHIECKSYFHDSLAFPPPSKLDAWTKLDQRFVEWQKSLACSVALHLPNQFFKFLVPAIDASLDFCRVVFPYLIDEYCCQNEYDGSITMILNNILRIGHTIDRDYSRLVIRLILFLREREPKTHSLKRQALVDEIDYLHAANAAVACNMYKTSLMFLDIAGKQEMSSSQQFAEQILSEVYRNVDDPDMTYALSKGINRSWNQLLDVYKLHHDRERVHELRRARLRGKVELGITPSFEDDDLRAVADLIRQNGFPLKAEGTTLSLNTSGGEDSSVSLYRSAWRLGNWDLPPTARSQETDSLLYTVLFHLVHASPLETFLPVLDSAIVQVVDRLSIEFNSAVHSKSTFCLSMLADLADLFSNSQPTMVARHWINQILQDACYGRYEELEPRASLHNAIFKIAETYSIVSHMLKTTTDDVKMMLVQSVLKFCEMTRRCGDSDDLLLALGKTGFLEQKFEHTKHSREVYPAVLAERAEILWKRHERIEAIQTLRSLVAIGIDKELSFTIVPKELVLANLASWTSHMRLSPSDAIIQDLLEPASRSLNKRSVTDGSTVGKLFFEYATFCTSQLEDQHAIADAKRIEGLHRSKQKEACQYVEAIASAKQRNDETAVKRLTKEWERVNKLENMDKAELQRLHNLQQTFLTKAIENFLTCFAVCNDFDHHVPKFCAIWLKHSKQKAVNIAVRNGLPAVPSYKFLSLTHQLCSRLSTESSEFQNNLNDLLFRILNDHPYHAVHQFFSTISSVGDSTALSRSSAATKIADRLGHGHKVGRISVKDISRRLGEQFSAYSDLANVPIDKRAHPSLDISFSSFPALRKFRSRSLAEFPLPPPSMKIAVSHDREYANSLYIERYHHSFRIAGGVNQPKILESVLSDGSTFRELVKGNDDLHQDAIMQQVFQEMDGVMQRNRETRRRKMRIRTYRVIPLRPKTGVIEWVLDTIPLLEYLEKTHVSVFPGDWKWAICRQKVYDAAQADHKERLEVYQNVCRHFHPVLRYFFLEYFKDPDDWLSKRVNFSRSVAASSMIGHILGLGDRHGQNILLDKKTGEVVHIDLGIAFEQGKMLFVPETVPFRLTRDIVDGFGISGCEGTFIRASTFALTVFREEEDTISTFLDVLKHDPLYNWTISPLKKWTVQQEMHGETGKESGKIPESLPEAEADRAIQMVKRKLASRLSAEADVRRLILEATDEGNLSRMYCGWAAFA